MSKPGACQRSSTTGGLDLPALFPLDRFVLAHLDSHSHTFVLQGDRPAHCCELAAVRVATLAPDGRAVQLRPRLWTGHAAGSGRRLLDIDSAQQGRPDDPSVGTELCRRALPSVAP